MSEQINRCYVCDKSEHQVKTLSASPPWFICSECVDECYQFLAEKRAERIEEQSAHENVALHERSPDDKYVHTLLNHFFHPLRPEELVTSSRIFSTWMRADLQNALDELFGNGELTSSFWGIHSNTPFIKFANLFQDREYAAPVIAPVQYTEVDIGEAFPVRCLENGLWLGEDNAMKFAVLLTRDMSCGEGVRLEIAVPAGEAGHLLTHRCFERLEDTVQKARSYRGKILSLEYSRLGSGITVHKLPVIRREDIILPQSTLMLIEKNIIRFAEQRAKLSELRMSVKRGILFYGLPGTGKTYTIQYLAGEMKDHTILLITAEQVVSLSIYISLARMLQPSIVVIEDVDLIARDRTEMDTPWAESLLNRLLNEMDGLREDAKITFILTTNRPEGLERALTARPGRIDQAIEFPLPDEESRRKLIELYSGGISISQEIIHHAASKTDKMSPAFIKELMRKAAQYYIEDNHPPQLTLDHIDHALEDMLFSGGTLNVKLLGGDISAIE